jgi:cysteine desulfuration protein SufE
MNLEEKQQAIIDDFNLFDDWMDKYEHIIELGKELPLLEDDLKTNDRIIEGCQSRVWLDARCVEGTMQFRADSDAIITKGIIGLLIHVLNNEEPKDVVTCDLHFIREIGLEEHLSPTRSNGLLSMVKRMKMEALKHVS